MKNNGNLITRKIIFGNPDKTVVRISRDHRMISYLAPWKGVLNIWIAPVDAPNKAQVITKDTNRGIHNYYWAFDNRHIIYLQDLEGDENWQIHALDIHEKVDRVLTPFEEIQGPDGKPVVLPNGRNLRPSAKVMNLSRHFPDEILIGLNNRNPQFHDLYKLNLTTGEMELILENDRFMYVITDSRFNVRVGLQQAADGGNWLFVPEDDGGWKVIEKIGFEEFLTTMPLSLDESGHILYMLDSRGRNTSALVEYDMVTGEKREVYVNPRADVSEVLIREREKKIIAVASNYERKEWSILDDSVKSDFEYLRTVTDGEIQIVSQSLDDSMWIVAFTKDDGPVSYYLMDRNKGRAEYLFPNRMELEKRKLAKMHPVVIKSRDGLDLVSYLTLPVGKDPKNSGRPSEPLPMVLLVHGGPWDRDKWGFDSEHQWLANRGYAVLSVNFRGSMGFGKEFTNAGDLEWGGRMYDDLVDAVNWAIENRIADKERLAIMGGSFGGYSTLVGMTSTPNLFACGIDIVGPSDLITFLNKIPPYWEPQKESLYRRIGDPRTEEGSEFLKSRSPITYVNRIERPLLIGQGANDPRVKRSESDQIVQAMKDNKIPVIYVLFPDEGHGFYRPENRMSFYAISELFLAEYLGGDTEPIDNDFSGSSLQVLEGKEILSGLREALERNIVGMDKGENN